jgi:TolB protein
VVARRRWIAFQRAPQLAFANELWRIPAAGGAPERLPTGDGPTWGAAFAPDAEQLVYAAQREGRWHLAITGPGKPERLLAVPPETTGYLRWPDWSPDGRRIAYERMRDQTNLWTVDLPLAPVGG